MIILDAQAGLCNRIYAITSAKKLSEETGHNLSILWDIDNVLGSSYDALFSNDLDLDITYTSNASYRTNPFKRFRSELLRGKLKHKSTLYLDVDAIRVLRQTPDLLKEIVAKGKNVYIKSYYYFIPENEINSQSLSFIVPSENIKKMGNHLWEKIAYNQTIGVHIRRTDHIDAMANSPLTLFEDRMKKELSKNPSVKFFLATDDALVEKKFIQKFGEDIIITQSNKTFSRKNVSGMEGAVIDLFALSKCKKIIGSYSSSFSFVASRISDIPLEIASNS